MVIRKNNFVFCALGHKNNIIYNKITDPVTHKSIYPDILFPHCFEESGLVDSSAYNEADKLMSEYGSAHCIFLSYRDDQDLKSIINAAILTDTGHHDSCDTTQIKDFCRDLSMSVTMENYMTRLLVYYSYRGNIDELITDIRSRYSLPVSKKEGKKIYEHIRELILQ